MRSIRPVSRKSAAVYNCTSHLAPDDIICEEKLGGVLKSYGWKVAA